MSYPSKPITFSSSTAVSDAVTEWWIQPISTYLKAPYERIVHGAISSTGEILACEHNISKNTTKRIAVYTDQIDDHNVPALYAEEGRRFVMAWSKHNADRFIKFKCSDISGDIATFEKATVYQFATTNVTAYAQLIKIKHLSSANVDVFWLFSRTQTTGADWQLIPVNVTQDTGTITFGTAITIFRSATGQQSYISVAEEHNIGQQVIRVAWGYNPGVSLHAIFGLRINCVTGAITNVQDPTLSANINGTGLPVLDTSLASFPFVAEPAGGNSRRLFYVRPGPDTFAIAYADWATATPDNATYRVREIDVPTTGLGMSKNSSLSVGYANAAYVAAMQTNTFEYEVFFKFSAEPKGLDEIELGKRSNVTANGNFYFRINNQRKLTLRLLFNSGQELSFFGTNALPGGWTDDLIGLRVVVNNALSPKVAIDYSLNDGGSWTNLESQNPAGLAGGFRPCTDPLIVGGLLLVNETSLLTIKRASFKTGTGGTLIAGVNFATTWPTGNTTYTDAAAVNWSLVGSATVDGYNPEIKDFGIAGPRVGYAASSNYIAGMAFENPSFRRAVFAAYSDSTTETIKRYHLDDMRQETILTGHTSAARLIRPYSPINGGPFNITYNNITSYSPVNYTQYLGDIKII
jgi:hypothetical protein